MREVTLIALTTKCNEHSPALSGPVSPTPQPPLRETLADTTWILSLALFTVLLYVYLMHALEVSRSFHSKLV